MCNRVCVILRRLPRRRQGCSGSASCINKINLPHVNGLLCMSLRDLQSKSWRSPSVRWGFPRLLTQPRNDKNRFYRCRGAIFMLYVPGNFPEKLQTFCIVCGQLQDDAAGVAVVTKQLAHTRHVHLAILSGQGGVHFFFCQLA